MQIAVIQFPGSNCERETKLAITRAGMTPVDFLWNDDVSILKKSDGFVIVGGFSYEDRSRAGVIASLDPVMKIVADQSRLGKPVLGICNGAQILVETGLVPGIKDNKSVVSLATNKRIQYDRVLGTGFYNDWVHLCLSEQARECAFTMGISKQQTLHVPIAHAEGRFVMPDELLKKIQAHGLNVFQYCDKAKKVDAEFPTNPNGSVDNIAGLANAAGNVLALMPHPERTPLGDAIFNSMRDYIAEKIEPKKLEIEHEINVGAPQPFSSSAHELLIELVITDNVALTVQNAFQQMGLPIVVKRYQHWDVVCGEEALQEVLASGELYNPSKEFLTEKSQLIQTQNCVSLLVRQKDDFIGRQKYQVLANHFEVNDIRSVTEGVLWQLSTNDASDIQDHMEAIFDSQILFNAIAQDCYVYG